MSEQPKNVVHETPDESILSSVIKDVSCPKGCPRTFSTTSALQMHLSKVHNHGDLTGRIIPQSIEVWYHCPVEGCIYNSILEDKGKHFSKLKYVKQHYQKVHGERTFACECLSSFSTASLLVQHKRLCGIQMMCSCDRSFGSLESLQTHIRRDNHIIHPNTTEAIQIRKMMQPTKSSPCINKKFGSNGNTNKRTGFVPILPAGPKIYTSNCSTPIQIASSCLNSVASVHLPPTSIAQVNSLNQGVGTMQQPIHLLAAVALGELGAHTGIKRSPCSCAEVGIQTDIYELKFTDKSSSPEFNEEQGEEAGSGYNKLKRSAETQTRLTLRDCKKIRCESPSVASSTTMKNKSQISNSLEKTAQECELVVSNYIRAGLEESVDSEESSLESLTLQVDLPEFMSSHQSTSGTQTSPRAPGSLNMNFTSNNSQIKYSINDLTLSMIENVREDQACMTTAATTAMSATQTPNYLDPFPSQLFDDDDDVLMAAVVGPSSSGHRLPPPLGQIRSSSIETQTDHDVLLSAKAGMLDENDIIFTTTETQTDPSTLLNTSRGNICQGPGSCQDHESCKILSSETQTCEDFSEIEQFLYSTIHTQTTDTSHSELFPELSFNDSHTQTGLEDTPGLVTTHTQTPHRGLTNYWQNSSRFLSYPQISTSMEYPTL